MKPAIRPARALRERILGTILAEHGRTLAALRRITRRDLQVEVLRALHHKRGTFPFIRLVFVKKHF